MSVMTKIVVTGASGRMGQMLIDTINQSDRAVLCGALDYITWELHPEREKVRRAHAKLEERADEIAQLKMALHNAETEVARVANVSREPQTGRARRSVPPARPTLACWPARALRASRPCWTAPRAG